MNESNIELEALRARAGGFFVLAGWLGVGIVLAVPLLRGTSLLLPLGLGAGIMGAATFLWLALGNSIIGRLTFGVAFMGIVAIIVGELAGHPWQNDAHALFFAGIAALAIFCDYRTLLVASLSATGLYVILSFAAPSLLFSGGADFWRVVLHVTLLMFEGAVLSHLSRRIVVLLARSSEQVAEIEKARGTESAAEQTRRETELQAQDEANQTIDRLVGSFEAKIGGIVSQVATAATEMKGTAESMSGTAENASMRAQKMAEAAEEAADNVRNVAAATDQFTSSINEIGMQVTRSAQIAGKAAEDARKTNNLVEGLASDAQKIGEVVTLINDIASQTNLLALNATIEAARAGEHGKGFAVVANEVKALANQTAKATDEISHQIQSIQDATTGAVRAIQGITSTIAEVHEIANAIASAVEEQGAAMRDISGNVHAATTGTGRVNANIDGVTGASGEVSTAASKVLSAASALATVSDKLRLEVKSFLSTIRAA